ncbi:hypothetical protein J2Z45_001829 [Cohnella lubricantis]|nr:hypothetical protein [Cohnella lubricantis]
MSSTIGGSNGIAALILILFILLVILLFACF